MTHRTGNLGMVPIFIEPATEADVPGLFSIMQANKSAPQWTFAHLTALFNQGRQLVERIVLVAKQESVTAGFVVVSIVSGTDPLEAELESIAVLPNQQRHGIGRALLDAASIWARKKSPHVLRLEVRASNEAALALYIHAGFVQRGIRRRYYSQPKEDAVLMERKLGSA